MPHHGPFNYGLEIQTEALPMNWILIRACLLFISLLTSFTFGRFSIEFRGTGTDWAMLVLYIVILICALIGLISGELVRAKAAANSN
jgi:hypothetical protein